MKESETRHLYPQFYRKKRELNRYEEDLLEELSVILCEIRNGRCFIQNNYKYLENKSEEGK